MKTVKSKIETSQQQLNIPVVIDSHICNCEQKSRTVWRIGASGRCLRCGGRYL